LIVEIVKAVVSTRPTHRRISGKSANLSGGCRSCDHTGIRQRKAFGDADAAQHVEMRMIQTAAGIKSNNNRSDATLSAVCRASTELRTQVAAATDEIAKQTSIATINILVIFSKHLTASEICFGFYFSNSRTFTIGNVLFVNML
jgi:hypothetical protein